MATFKPIPEAPGGLGYRCAVLDPPWSFQDKATRNAPEKASGAMYGTLSIEDIAELPMPSLLASAAIVFLWVPDTHIFEAKWLLDWWGLAYKHLAVWIKMPAENDLDALADAELAGDAPEPQMGMGNYMRRSHEVALLATTIPFHPRAELHSHKVRSVIIGPRGRHSQKPEGLQDAAEQLISGPYLELFARRRRAGWTCWGNELTEE